MSAERALAGTRIALLTLNAKQARLGMPPLEEAPMTAEQRAAEVTYRLQDAVMTAATRPGADVVPVLEAAAAHLVAWMAAADAAAQNDIVAGQEAA